MATDISSPQRFFHMPRFQHQAPRQVFYKRPDFAQQQAMQQLTFDGKRMRKAVNRKTIDYNPSVIRYLENRLWQRDHRDFRAIQPDAGCYNDLVPPVGMLSNPMNAVTTKFVRTSTNKVKCPVFVIRWTPEGRRLVTGASSGEFTLWNGLTFNFETILQAHDSPVRAMTWSHNDMWMLTADHGGYVKYWQSNMNNVKMFQAHKEAIREASFSPTDNKFATCSDDGTVRIWDFLRCHEERILRGHGADVKCVDWHPTKGLVVSGSKDSQQPIKFWDPKTGQSLATLHAHKNTVMEVKWNLNGNWLLTASRDHLCKLFDIRNLKEELQVFRGHKKEATAVAWHPIHEGLFASGGSDGSLLFWHTGVEKEVGGMEMAHEGMIWSLAWHPLGHILCSGSNDHTSKFWTRNRPGDKMRDRYNLNLLPGMSEDGLEYDDIEPNSVAAIPGMGIPEQLKAAMEQEQSLKMATPEVEMSIPGLDWGMDEVMGKDTKRVPQKKVPYAKPIPAQFQQAWAENKVPIMSPSGELLKDRKPEQKADLKKKSQAEIDQERAALQYTNPMLLEQIKQDRMNQASTDGNIVPQQGQGTGSNLAVTAGGPGQQSFSQNMPQQLPNNIGSSLGPGGMQPPFMSGQMGQPSGPQSHQGTPLGMIGPPEQGPRHFGPSRNIGLQGSHSLGPRGMQGPPTGMMGPSPRVMGSRDTQGGGPHGGIMPPQGSMMGPQGPVPGGMMGHPPRAHVNMPNNFGMVNMQGASGGMHKPQANIQGPSSNSMQGPHANMQGPPGNMQGSRGNMQEPLYMQHQGQTSGPLVHGLGQQGPNTKGDSRGPPLNLHMGSPDQLGPGGPDQGSGPYWGDNQQSCCGPQEYEGGQDFQGGRDENWRSGPAYPGGYRGGHRGGGNGGNWGPDERFSEGDFRGRWDGRFRGGGPGRLGGRCYPEEYVGQEEDFDGPEEMSRSWDSGGRGRPTRLGGPDGYGERLQMQDGTSSSGRDRTSSLQGMDMASLPPRKRPWQDGPGLGDPRERESARPDGGRPAQRDDVGYNSSSRGGRSGWGSGGGPGSGPCPRRGGPLPRGVPRGGVRGR
ncbi:pre-mRNA 3' end processing protein WDR33 isoform X3 [Gouania willdenowi]|uniref:pre-mRNA 3' end processing protein WDR33 n=1 Tax=Gouania willdenowi TaxID=441366 RepID=A0A8C5DJC8_GOUWI|nr:pre-mRNA 3' end processing protein WDR33 isoform X3 [Gouania willdenowi]